MDPCAPSRIEQLKRHAIKRMRERVGYVLSRAEYERLVELIYRGEAGYALLDKPSHTKSIYAVKGRGNWGAVLYVKRLGIVVTVYYPEWIRGIEPEDWPDPIPLDTL